MTLPGLVLKESHFCFLCISKHEAWALHSSSMIDWRGKLRLGLKCKKIGDVSESTIAASEEFESVAVPETAVENLEEDPQEELEVLPEEDAYLSSSHACVKC